MRLALFAGVLNGLALVSLGCDAHHGVCKARGYRKRPKRGSYTDAPPRQSPELVCKHWRQTATLQKVPTLFIWRLLANGTTQFNENCTKTLLVPCSFAPAAVRASRPRRRHPHGGLEPDRKAPRSPLARAARRSLGASFVTSCPTHTLFTATDRP